MQCIYRRCMCDECEGEHTRDLAATSNIKYALFLIPVHCQQHYAVAGRLARVHHGTPNPSALTHIAYMGKTKLYTFVHDIR